HVAACKAAYAGSIPTQASIATPVGTRCGARLVAAVQGESTVKFPLQRRDDVSPSARIWWCGREYVVPLVMNIETRNRELLP
ncbi:MAG: hypothetical protein ABI451_02140, partial [Dokdonella sp.]